MPLLVSCLSILIKFCVLIWMNSNKQTTDVPIPGGFAKPSSKDLLNLNLNPVWFSY